MNKQSWEQDLSASLRRLAKETRGREAAPRVEAALREAVRARRRDNRPSRRWFPAAVAAGIATVLLAVGLQKLADPGAPPRPADEEVATPFVALPYLGVEEPFEQAQILRIGMPRSALVRLGVPLEAAPPEEFLQADVLVSEDGRARAIRFVRISE